MPVSNSLSVLGLPEGALLKLASLDIKTVAAFYGRVLDAPAAERLRNYIEVDRATMDAAIERARDESEPVVVRQVGGGALIR